MADVCHVKTAEINQDANRLSALLQAGDPQFLTDLHSLYGPKAPKACATQELITDLSKLDPTDVHINGNNYEIDVWRIYCTQAIDDLKNHKSIAAVSQNISKQIRPADRTKFMVEFNSRATAQQLHVRLAANSNQELELVTA